MQEIEKEHPAAGPVSRAIRELRQAYGESQQAFAHRMNSAIRTIARYETVRPPRGAELGQFLELAIAKQRHDLSEVFARALADELAMKAERIPRTLEEGIYADLLFLTMRNRQTSGSLGFQESDAAFRQLQDTLVENFKFLAQKLRSGKTVLGLDEEDLEILDGEVRFIESELAKEETKAKKETKK